MRSVFYVILCVCVLAMQASGAMADQDNSKKFIQGLGDKVIAIVADKKVKDDKKEQQLDALFIATVDINWIAKFVAGRYWKEATPAQQKTYQDKYKKFLLSSYVSKFKQYTGQKMVVNKSDMEAEGEYLVETNIDDQDGKSYKIDYKIRKAGNSFKIYDIIAEGVSMITTQRSEFGSILDREGMDSLIAKLESKK